MPQHKWTITAIKAANKKAGRYWFSKGAMASFNSKIGGIVYQGPGGIFFTTSEEFGYGRSSSVRQFNPGKSSISTVGDGHEWTPERALNIAYHCAQYGVEQALAD